MPLRLRSSHPLIRRYGLYALRLPRAPKYHNEPVTVDGVRFDSQKEARRFAALQWREKAGEIADLRAHPKFELVVNGVRVGCFTPDASYIENGVTVAEDTKAEPTRKETAYRLRVRVFKACFPTVRFVEV